MVTTDLQRGQSGAICESGIHVLQLLFGGCNLFEFTATEWRFMIQITCLFVRWKQLLANNQLGVLFFVYLFHLSTCFEHHSAHHQETELY